MSFVVPSFSLKFLSSLTYNARSVRFFKVITSKHAIKLNYFGIEKCGLYMDVYGNFNKTDLHLLNGALIFLSKVLLLQYVD